jgi:hypothetical protein
MMHKPPSAANPTALLTFVLASCSGLRWQAVEP